MLAACGGRTGEDDPRDGSWVSGGGGSAGTVSAVGGAGGSSGASAAGGGAGVAGCGGRPGPAMVAVVGAAIGCIDATEVTNADYAAFLATAPSGSAQPPSCAGNDSLAPAFGWPASAAHQAFPVVNVDWCDARAYCAWAGKRLCPGTFAMPESEGGSAWMHVCTAAGTHDYPYGSAYMSGGCNGKDAGVGEAVAAGASGVCTTTSGVLDLSGNVWEWEDACESDAPDARCRVRGGSFRSDQNNLACAASFADARLTTFDDFGFRCCAD